MFIFNTKISLSTFFVLVEKYIINYLLYYNKRLTITFLRDIVSSKILVYKEDFINNQLTLKLAFFSHMNSHFND